MAKEFLFRGKTLDELQQLSVAEFAALVAARERRALLRGFSHDQKKLLEHIEKKKKNLRTHCRDMVIIPQLVGSAIGVYSGKEWVLVNVEKELLGHRLGEFVITRKKVSHSAPGIGATKSSASLSVR